MYSIPVLEPGSPKLSCQQDMLPLEEALRKDPSLSLPASSGPRVPWLVVASLQSLPLTSHDLLFLPVSCPYLSLKKTLFFEAHLGNPGFKPTWVVLFHLKILNLITCAKTLFFQIRSQSEVWS